MTLPVAVDAMGGDRAPASIVEGARMAAEEHGVPVVLVGRADDLPDTRGLPVVNASEVIEMGDDPAQGVRRKKDASVVRAAEMVRDGTAIAMVSAGNTGAAMVAALLRMGRIKGVSRPAVAASIPVPGMGSPTPTILLDAGANAECQPEWLAQFALMGSTYFRHRYGGASPRVGLLSIGEESMKGNTLVKATHELLVAIPELNFIGNVEGRDMLTDDVDVVVTDGFTGNVVLKTLEGCGVAVSRAFVDALGSSEQYRQATGVLSPVLDPLLVSIDYETYGGAMLLGVDGVCIIGHGSSQALAVSNAIVLAQEMATEGVVGELRSAITPG